MSDCQIIDAVYCGLELRDCHRCRISNNTIVDRRAEPTMRHAIRLAGTNEHVLLSANILGGATESLLSGISSPTEGRDNLLIDEI
jgi:hypothetical protein